jgi:pyruvate,water dikinase
MATAQRPQTAAADVILDLALAGPSQLSTVGGKAANLGELIRAGLPVPPGFCVTTEAYRRIAGEAGLADLLATSGNAANLAERARDALLAVPVPADLAEAIGHAYRAIGDDVPVAVRSSATAEDLPSASFAGQQDTYLNVVGTDALIDAVRRCWASLWTDRAVSYRGSNDVDHATVRLSVVVQQMIEADVAGVLFTADPVTGHRGHTVIDASPGLGEAVVSGAVNPDHFVTDAAGTVLQRRLGDKRVVVRSLPGGGTETVNLAADDTRSCIDDTQVAELTALGQRVQAHYGTPQDTEWALDHDGELWLTQARPITTLYPLPVRTTEGTRVYFCVSLAQGLTRPVTPMGISGFRTMGSCAAELVFGVPVTDPIAGPEAFTEAGQRPFIDITPVLRSRIGRLVVPRILDVMEARSAVVLRNLAADPRFPEPASSGRWRFVRQLAKVAVRFKVPVWLLQAIISPAAARRRVARFGRDLRARLSVPEAITSAQRLDHLERVLHTQVIPIMPTVVPAPGGGFLAMGLASKLAGEDIRPGEMNEVLRGLPHNVTTEMDLELWELAKRIKRDAGVFTDTPAELARRFADGSLPESVQHGLTTFLAEHGHHAVAEIDIGMPRWSDDPTYLLGVLANYLRLTDEHATPDAVFANGARAAEGTVRDIVGRVRQRSRPRAAAVRFALARTRELAGMRETHKDYLVLAIAHVREQLAVVGAEIAKAGRLDAAEDVYFLDLKQARAALGGADLRGLVAQRREEYERELRRRQVPRVVLSDGTQPEAMAAAGRPVDGDQLTGTPASSGSATAPARVILDPVGAHLEPGEILVAPSTDPGWTPLFLTAGGLVMEMGGANSHGAVVAREYGIPAVVGIADATLRISTGQRITVHGATGEVDLAEVHEPRPE